MDGRTDRQTDQRCKKGENIVRIASMHHSEYILKIFALHLHLADAFIQSDLQLHSGYTFSLVHVFPGNRTHNLLRC